MTTYGDFLYVGKRLYVNGKEVLPNDDPIGNPTLSEVLTAGNTAPGQEINVGKLTAGVNSDLHVNSDINADSMECTNLGAVDVIATNAVSALTVNATNVVGVADLVATGITSTGVINWTAFQPPLVVSGTAALSQVLGAGDDAGTQYIINCGKVTFQKQAEDTQSEIIGEADPKTKCTNLDLTDPSNSFPGAVAGDLAATLALGNSAGTNDIEMNNQSILNANAIGAEAVGATQVASTTVNCKACTVAGSTTIGGSGILNLNNASATTNVKIDFTGYTGPGALVDTFIEGDTSQINGQAKRTKCTYLDLTDGTNLIPIDAVDYRWGLFYAPLNTAFKRDFDDVFVVFGEQIYFDWSSSIAEHSSCFFDIQFYVDEYGYGDAQLGWFWQPSDLSTGRVQYPNSLQLIQPNESATAFRDVRKTGTYRVITLLNNLPTTGVSYRFWPAIKTNEGNDDASTGRLIVKAKAYSTAITDEDNRGAPIIIEVKPRPPTSRFRIVTTCLLYTSPSPRD